MTASTLDRLAPLFARYRSPAALRLYDEAVTELDHALQCAALARADGAGPASVAAALLHDVGHLVLDDNVAITDELTADAHHERAGARYLSTWFDRTVTAPVALHVAAKRYLCAIDPEYLDSLSPSSIRSLALQGGPMDRDERSAFELRPHSADAVALRRWDDEAKVAGLDVPPFDSYADLLVSLARRSKRIDERNIHGEQ